MLAGGQLGFMELTSHDDDVIWSEYRPAEDRVAVMRRRGHSIEEIAPAFNARTLVHEYGGASIATDGDAVVASRFEDQRMYRIDGVEPRPITPVPPEPRVWRYADAVIADGWVVAVRENHAGGGEARHDLAAFPVDGRAEPVTVTSGYDFYSTPRISPDGAHIAWLAWNHPNMPWDETHLWVADWLAPEIRSARRVPSFDDESLFQPTWTAAGELLVSADRTGWWNIYRVDGDVLEPRLPTEREVGLPGWMFGWSTFALTATGRLVTAVADRGMWSLEVDGDPVDIGERSAFGGLMTVVGEQVWTVFGGPSTPMSVLTVDLERGTVEVVRRSSEVDLDERFISRPVPISYPTTEGGEAHAFFYPPTNPDHRPPEGALPPLIVFSHGGPTAQTYSTLQLSVQFWTTRGFAIADVNYRGSTGHGRAYRDALRGRWGELDVEDCVEAARHLASIGKVDPARLAIRGGSAGGFVTLCALTFHDVFAAGTSYCGVADIEALMETTHKFESRYDHRLVGPPDRAEARYRERSPIHHADRITCPVLIIQGSDDPIVTPDQAEVFVDAMHANGLPHSFLLIEGEDHFLGKAETVVRTRQAELSFYGQLFGFEPAGEIPRLSITNLD